MSKYTFGKFALAIVILLAFATAGRAQVAPTQEQLRFVSVLGGRIESKSQEEIKTLQEGQLEKAIKAEQQAKLVSRNLTGQACGLAARIEFLSWLVREYPRMRGNMDQNTMQRVNAWQAEVTELKSKLHDVNTKLKKATTALKDARERRLAEERNVAFRQAANKQQLTDLRYLYDMSQLSPPRFRWETMMERITAVAREKKLTSNVTISTGVAPVTVRYQLVSGGPVSPPTNCRQCVLNIPVGYYNFWVETPGSGAPQKTAYYIFREKDTIPSQPNPNGH